MSLHNAASGLAGFLRTLSNADIVRQIGARVYAVATDRICNSACSKDHSNLRVG